MTDPDASQAAAQAAPMAEPTAGPVAILLVDDHPENLLALEGALEPLGQRLVRAASGAEALRQVLAQDFSAILLDVRMPILDGYQTAEIIRMRERSRTTPILFLTAHPASEVQVFQGYASGAVDFITKPCAPEILRSKVRVFVELALHAQALDALNRQLERLNAELQDSNRELDGFSHSVSHDLRAPLRQMRGFLALLEGRLEACGDVQGAAYLASALDAAGRMDLLIEGLLGFAGLSRRELSLAPVDLNPLLGSVLEAVRADQGDRSIDWRLGELPTIRGDAPLLRAAFLNLLDNAAKFTRRQARAVIEVGALPGPPGEWRVFVRDNGAGFDPAYAHRLFGVFQRLHRQEEFEGTGIGLANVQRIVQRHRGRVWAEGLPGQGATFHLAFPREPAP
jgi:signal transduction histidine kinase